ncbi:MAG: DUF6452 family protein [Polaribacter sp.]|uniref:DUF6452 family protein n=1 Tax=Polaribacter sp. TaxID=1920175 RepID=UPI0026066D48|nr:DUF6452 family protein [Polaribacter sp.]MBT3741689.1 hypothetical protein [Polaribacter sp.]MBT4414111.1 hypothetical protein [Polaribacter sp.]MDG1196342.1 DUF6452 family protein [Polaribacter sp.]MDG1403313.1 DUF6452 family protein [Polaribacter sp.]MDG2436117.1 DUF6452 family protein [Polaribacter sp.]
MRKIIIFIFLSIIIISACEKDDFCVQNPITPNLVLRFYDANNREALKSVSSFYIWAEGKDTIFENISADSIYIPLNSLATETVYNFSKGNTINQFTIKYTPEDEYISRSCGFRTIFNEVTFISDNTWISDFTPEEVTTIDHQNEAHVQIFH